MLATRDLACRRGRRLLLEGLTLALQAGEALLLRGANGSGKTSLLRLLGGFLAPAAGSIGWDGADVSADLAGHRARLHLLGFQNALPGPLTAREALAAAAGVLGERGREAEALARLGLDHAADTPVRWLSSGQRRRLALARLVAAPRPLWLLDEPLVGLDRTGRAVVEELIARHRAEGGLAVIASHDELALPGALLLDLDR